MHDSDKSRFGAILIGIADYYGKPLSPGVIALYWEGLKHFDLRAVEKALWEHTQNPDTGQFMPKIADVVKMLQGRTTDQAAIAWSKVDQAVRRVGTYRDVVFDDPIIHRVIDDMGGWIKLGTLTEDEWQFFGNQFRTRYQGYRIRNEVPEYHPVLIGIANAQNGKNGIKGQEPILIGNEAKAAQVRLGGTNAPLLAIKQASEFLGTPERIAAA